MSHTTRRVVVTGIGVVSALGPDLRALRDGLWHSRCGVKQVTLFDTTGCRSALAAQAEEPAFPEGALPRLTSRPDRFGLRAALDAVADAGLGPDERAGAAVLFGTGTGGAPQTEAYMIARAAGERPAADCFVSHQPAAVTDLVARVLGCAGPRSTVMTACSSSAVSLGLGLDLLRLGRAEVALCGGAEGLCRLTYLGFGALRALSPDPCRPFDRDRRGLNLGEGAAVLVLETEAHAQRRGARIYAEFAGYGATADGHHMTAPHPEGLGAARAMRSALRDAGLGPEDIGYVNAHGTATPHNDAAETAALASVFGTRRVPVSSIKAAVGHTLGAAGAIEAAAATLAVAEGLLPATVNLQTPDPAFTAGRPDLDFDFVQGAARRVDGGVPAVLSSSFAFGGNNAVLIFRRVG